MNVLVEANREKIVQNENGLHGLYYNYANNHAFTTFWTIVRKLCTDRFEYC